MAAKRDTRAKAKSTAKPRASKARAPKPKAEKKPHGRPSLYNEELGEEICRLLKDGWTLNQLCRKHEGFPHESTVRSWAANPDHPFSTKYVQAREIGYLRMADELLEISDDGANDWMVREGKDGENLGWQLNGEHVQRSRLRADTRKWLLSKALPKIYGDKQIKEVSGPDGGPIEVKEVDDIELAREIAYQFGRAVERGSKQAADADD